MTNYIAMLRGINIGGHNVPMAQLRELMSELGFSNVRTYIQTGNVFFNSEETDQRALESKIAAHLEKSLGYKVPTFVRTLEEVESALLPNPFEDIEVTPQTRLIVLFISPSLPDDVSIPLQATTGGTEISILKATAGEILMVMKQLNDRPGNPVPYLEKTYGITATARFYHTALKILQAAKEENEPK